jgi:DNA segregation ATPase FtsK/SpoIIIE-like protein
LITENLEDNIKHELVRRYNLEYENNKNKISNILFKENIPEKAQWFSSKSMEKIDVPVGINKSNGKIQKLSFFTKQPLPHALLSGGTGSGKTNFLKTYIVYPSGIAINTAKRKRLLLDLDTLQKV